MGSYLHHIVLKFSLCLIFPSHHIICCVWVLSPFCFFPIFHAPLFFLLFTAFPELVILEIMTSISIEINKYISAHHLFFGWWNITVYVISYPVYMWHKCRKYPPRYRKNKRWTETPNHFHEVCPKMFCPRRMRLQRPCQCGCLSPSGSETCFSTNCDKFWSCFTRSLCYFWVFFLVKDKTKLSVSDKKEEKKYKACSSAVFKNFC